MADLTKIFPDHLGDYIKVGEDCYEYVGPTDDAVTDAADVFDTYADCDTCIAATLSSSSSSSSLGFSSSSSSLGFSSSLSSNSSSSQSDNSSSYSSLSDDCNEDWPLALNVDGSAATDISGVGHDITASGAGSIDNTQSYAGSDSMKIGGSGGYFWLTNDAGTPFADADSCFNLSTSNFDIRFAMRWDGAGSSMTLISKWGSAPNRGWTLDFYDDGGTWKLGFAWTSDGTSFSLEDVDVDATIAADTWYEIRVARSGSSCKIYVDGTAVHTFTNGDDIFSDNTVMTIGNNLEFTPAGFNGWIDQVWIQVGGTVDLSDYTPSASLFAAPIPYL